MIATQSKPFMHYNEYALNNPLLATDICRICGCDKEIIRYITSGCKALEQRNIKRHDLEMALKSA
jgi:hypothetical protein